jgi:predicted KAP-like P-loop ATPase
VTQKEPTGRKKPRKKRAQKPSLLADAPLTDLKLDRLGRAGFAHALADSILQLEGQDSIVIGICGPWGSGKSTVLNFLVAELEKSRRKDKPLVLHFNPWWFSGQDRLLQAFLQQLGAILNRAEKDKPVKKASSLLGKFSTILKPMSLIPFVGEYAKMAQEAAAAAAEVTKQYAEALAADLNLIRKEIDDLLGELPHRIVIIMDDIDRLTASEIGQLFAILKAVADFTNTVYVLAYDERVVRRAIHSTLGINGKTYLEKIVQLPIDRPAPDRMTLQQLFLEQLQELLDDQDASQLAESVDFGNIFHDGVKHFLMTPRACKRLMNVLRFTYPPLKGEVYLPDIVVVSCLTAFVPQVVRTITAHPDQFIGHSDWREGRLSGEGKSAEVFHKRWLAKVEDRDRSAVQRIVRRLFPKADAALGGSQHGGEWEIHWRTGLRVCSEEHFDKYFLLSVPGGAMTEAEWQEFVGLLEDREAFKQRLLQSCDQTGRRGFVSQAKEALDRLRDFVALQANPVQARHVFEAVIAVGDELAGTKDKDLMGGFVPITNENRIWWLLPQALAKLPTPNDRVQLIEETLKQSVGLYTAADLVRFLGNQHGMYSSSNEKRTSPEPPLIPTEKVKELAEVVVKKIEVAAADGTLAAHPSFTGIFWYWQLFGHGAEAAEWMRQLVQSDEQLVKTIRQREGKIQAQSISDRVATTIPHVDCDFFFQFLPAQELRQRCTDLLAAAPDWLTSDDRKALQVVVATIGEDGSINDPRPGRRRTQHRNPSDAGSQNADQPATPSGEIEPI